MRLNDGLSTLDIDRISKQMESRLNSFEAQEFLNVSGEALQLLRKRAILVPIIDALDQIPKYERNDPEQFLWRLQQQVSVKAGLNDETVTIADASRRVRCPSAEIIELILDGKLTIVLWDESVAGLAGFKVSLPELKRALPPLEMQGMTKGEAACLLRVSYPTINYFIAEGLLVSMYVRNPRSRQFLHAVCSDSIEAFQGTYETLGHLAKRYRRPSGPLGCHLEAKDICPIETPAGISWYYERNGLEARLRKIGLQVPDHPR